MNMKLPMSFSTIPVSGKVPLVKWEEFTKRIPTINEWTNWQKQYPLCDKGIITGPISGILVLDDDGGLDVQKYPIPRTLAQKTPRGGQHYFFRWTQDLDQKVTTKAGILDKVDVRGQSGFVRFYGFNQLYTTLPIARPPQWLIDLLPNKGTVNTLNSIVGKLNDIKEGNRNASFASLAGGLRARGYTADVIFELLKPKAREVNFSESELLAVCKSISRYEPTKIDGQGQDIESFMADQTSVKWICEPFIAEQSIGFIAGLPESRKSWILIDLAIECARGGGLWLNKFPVKGRKVLLIDQERSKSEVQRRLQAVLSAKGIATQSISLQLYIRCGTSTRIDLQNSYDALRKEMADIRPDIVLIDAFATFHTKNESNRMEIQQVLERIKELRNEFKCSIIIIHHETKQAYQNKKDGAESSYLDMAGNVAIPAVAEFCMNVVKHDEESSFCHHTKCTQGTKMAPFLVRVRDLEPDHSKIVVEAY